MKTWTRTALLALTTLQTAAPVSADEGLHRLELVMTPVGRAVVRVNASDRPLEDRAEATARLLAFVASVKRGEDVKAAGDALEDALADYPAALQELRDALHALAERDAEPIVIPAEHAEAFLAGLAEYRRGLTGLVDQADACLRRHAGDLPNATSFALGTELHHAMTRVGELARHLCHELEEESP